MKKRNGFTLIELITVIVILGLIMMVVIPALNKSNLGNERKKIDEYYKIIEEASLQYATTFKNEELGDATESGCVRFSFDELKTTNLISDFHDKTYNCSMARDITVRNENGNYYTNFKLKCEKKENAYKYFNQQALNVGEEDTNSCNRSIKKEPKILIEELVKNNGIEINQIFNKTRFSNNSTINYINEYNNRYKNNTYVYYSSQLWHIYARDKNGGFKAYSMDAITSIPYSINGYKDYKRSDVRNYLESVYFNQLKDTNKYLSLFRNNENIRKIGIPTVDDFDEAIASLMISEMANHNYKFHLLSQDNKIYVANIFNKNSKTVEFGRDDGIEAVIPVVTFSSNAEVYEGNGTIKNPYVLARNKWSLETTADISIKTSALKVGDHVDVRYKDEYRTFRVMENKNGYPRLISMDTTAKNPYIENKNIVQTNLDEDDRVKTYDNILMGFNVNTLVFGSAEENITACKGNGIVKTGNYGKYNQINCYYNLNKESENKSEDIALVSNFCTEKFNFQTNKFLTKPECQYPKDNLVSSKINGVKLGELYATAVRNYESNYHVDKFWTITPSFINKSIDSKMWTIEASGEGKEELAEGEVINSVDTRSYDYKQDKIYGNRVVVKINKNLKIIGGKGTRYNPYRIENL